MESARKEYEEDPNDEQWQGKPFDEANYLFCPINCTGVDPDVMIPNVGMRA